MNRLRTVTANFDDKLKSSNELQQRQAAILAARLAIEAASKTNVQNILEKLVSDGYLNENIIRELTQIAEEFDNRYYDLQEKPDEYEKSLTYFSQARAVMALAFAGGSDPLDSARESIYEAYMSFENGEELLHKIHICLQEEAKK